MTRTKRNAVFVALQGTIGRELIFKHYTDKVVAAKYPEKIKTEPAPKTKRVKK